ncbi:MAG: glycosyltransferase family 2 protein [Planctomycetota bacterium]|jgi:undecaprenyl-phosphate 4-deoxy-4-formamido-L-arabinose transferase
MLNSIVIPVYNGAASVGRLVDTLFNNFPAGELQIVLVNDCSPDNSDEVCSALAEKYPDSLKYIKLAKNFGEHNAVMAGLSFVEGEYTVIMDDDFQNPPEEVANLFNEAAEKKYDVVYTYYEKKEHHWARNLGSRFNGFMANFMLQKPKDLYLSSFKAISRFTVNEILKYSGPYPYIDGLILRSTKNIGKLKVEHQPRMEGESSYTLRKLIRLWLNMFVNFSVMPLRLGTVLGSILCLCGLIMSVIVVAEKVLYPEVEVGWASMMLAVMIFSGAQLFILGLLGEYLGRLFLSSNNTPQYVVREITEKGVKKEI